MPDDPYTLAQLIAALADNGDGDITPEVMRRFAKTVFTPEALLSDAATIPWNLDVNARARVVLGGNRTIQISGGEDGMTYRLAAIQDGSGNRVPIITGANILGGAPQWKSNAGAVNTINVDIINGQRYYAVL